MGVLYATFQFQGVPVSGTATYNPAGGTVLPGLAQFGIAANALGQSPVGNIFVHFDVYEGDPGLEGLLLSSGQSISHGAGIDILSASMDTPEPGRFVSGAAGPGRPRTAPQIHFDELI